MIGHRMRFKTGPTLLGLLIVHNKLFLQRNKVLHRKRKKNAFKDEHGTCILDILISLN